MKYKLERISDNFKPFSLTLTFETREEHVHFRDHVMPELTRQASRVILGDLYRMANNEIDSAEGKV